MVTLADRVKVATSTTGTGTITLGSAESGYQSFADGGIADGDTVRYVIEDGTDWEIGTGTYTSSGTTLSRTVTSSSNSDNALNLSGSAVVFISPAAQDLQIVHVYSATTDLPSATDNHGMIAHVHGEGAMYFAHGGNWVELANADDVSSGTYDYSTTEFTATASQTAFTGTYDVDHTEVYLNGVLLLPTTDYTINSTTVTLTSAAALNDVVQVQQYVIAASSGGGSGGGGSGTDIDWGGDRHVNLGGYVTGMGNRNWIDYFSSTDSTSSTFGDLTVARYSCGSVSNQTRLVALGGFNSNVLDYITVSTTGNATDFGDTNQSASYNAYVQSAGDGTYGVYVGNGSTGEYITIATTGNASQFGSIGANIYGSGGGGDGTYGIFTENASTSAINYITIGTSGTGSTFGNLLNSASYAGLCSDNTYTMIQRGTGTDVEYVTTATTGNSSDFGDLTVSKTFSSMSSDGTYGICAGASTSGNTKVMDKFTIATTGNATDMGDLARSFSYHTQSSGSSS